MNDVSGSKLQKKTRQKKTSEGFFAPLKNVPRPSLHSTLPISSLSLPPLSSFSLSPSLNIINFTSCLKNRCLTLVVRTSFDHRVTYLVMMQMMFRSLCSINCMSSRLFWSCNYPSFISLSFFISVVQSLLPLSRSISSSSPTLHISSLITFRLFSRSLTCFVTSSFSIPGKRGSLSICHFFLPPAFSIPTSFFFWRKNIHNLESPVRPSSQQKGGTLSCIILLLLLRERESPSQPGDLSYLFFFF